MSLTDEALLTAIKALEPDRRIRAIAGPQGIYIFREQRAGQLLPWQVETLADGEWKPCREGAPFSELTPAYPRG